VAGVRAAVGIGLAQPHDRIAQVRTDAAAHPAVRLDAFHARSDGVAADRDMADRAGDLAGLERDHTAMLAAYRPRLDRYRAGALPGQDAIVERMRLMHDYRRFPFRDPDLPPELLPAGWSGRAAHEVFLEAHGLLRAAADGFVDAMAERPGRTS
jgi:phenylacetic acid degradation operon negative regulatory protein